MKYKVIAVVGVLLTALGLYSVFFAPNEASSIGIIGGADGPTSIFITSKLPGHFMIGILVLGILLIGYVAYVFLKKRK